MFVDDCDLNVKVKALQEVRVMFKAQLDNLAAITNEMPELSAAVTGLSNLNKKMDTIVNTITYEINGLKEIFEDLALKDAYKKANRRD